MNITEQYKAPNKFYFTFASSDLFPFSNGWVEIYAKTRNEAVEKFDRTFGENSRRPGGSINCSFIYTHEEFVNTVMYKTGSNLGGGCHMVIS